MLCLGTAGPLTLVQVCQLSSALAFNTPCPLRASQSACRSQGAPDTSSYGIDPAFKPGTASFQPDLVAPDDAPMLDEYDCAALAAGTPTYNLVDPLTGLTTNRRPYCAQLFNPRCGGGGAARCQPMHACGAPCSAGRGPSCMLPCACP